MTDDRKAWALELVGRLAALPQRQADAVGLLYFRSLRYAEIATDLGLTLAEVRVAVAAGMLGLGAALTVET